MRSTLFFAPCEQPVMHEPQRTQSANEMPCGVAPKVPPAPRLLAADDSHRSWSLENGLVSTPSIEAAVA